VDHEDDHSVGDVSDEVSATSYRFIRQAAGTIGIQIATLGLGASAGIIAARILGPSGRGELAVAVLGPSLAGLAVVLGFQMSNVYFVGRRLVVPAAALGTSVVAGAAGSIPAVTAYLVIAFVLRGSLLHGLDAKLIVIGGGMVPLLVVLRYVNGVAQGLGAIAIVNLGTLLQVTAQLGLNALLLVALHRGVTTALIIIVASPLVALITVAGAVWRQSGRPLFSIAYLRRATRFGARADAGNLLGVLNYRLDTFLVTGFLGYRATGLYAVAVAVGELALNLPNAIALVLLSHVARGSDSASSATQRATRVATSIMLLCLVPAAFLGPWALPVLYGRDFVGGVAAFEALLPGIFFLSLDKLLSADLTGRGRPGIPTTAALAALVANIGVDVVLIPRLGVVGAGVGSSAAYFIASAIAMFAFVSITRSTLWSVLAPTRGDLCIILGAVRAELRRVTALLR
jgi:O-antigen/teichoic acid export membrane protein